MCEVKMKVLSYAVVMFVFLNFSLKPSIGFSEEIPKNSIYQIKSTWITQENKKINLNSIAGKPVIIGMVYTGCEHACPLTISRILEIEKKIKTKGIKDYQIVLASFDTKNDRPEHLKKYMAKRDLDLAHWLMLTADQDETVRELAIVLGINYKKIDDKDFSHSNVLTLLDNQGVSLVRVEGLSSETETLINKLSSLNGK